MHKFAQAAGAEEQVERIFASVKSLCFSLGFIKEVHKVKDMGGG